MRRFLVLAIVGSVALPAGARAQERRFAVDARVATGLSVGGGDGHASVRRTPLFVEAGMHTWLAAEEGFVLGASVRVELEDRVSIGGVVRAGLRARLGALELRPSLGVVAILAPYTLLGAEAGAMMVLHLDGSASILAQIAIDGFLFGSDLPNGNAIAMFNGGLGLEIAI